MLGAKFKPWGELKWVLSKYKPQTWDLIGSLSTEERCLSIFNEISSDNIDKVLMYEIIDPPSRSDGEIKIKLKLNKSVFLAKGRSEKEIEFHDLLESQNLIVESIEKFINNSGGNVIFDISSFPKRFFFPILKILNRKELTNLIVVYSTPREYAKNDLSGNPDTWAHLPLFGPVIYPEPQIDVAIVGVGFMPFGLSKLLLSKYNTVSIKLIFPFPPGPPNYQRTWEFIRNMEELPNSQPINNQIIRVSSNNTPDAFDFILKETSGGQKSAIFAPYGPKPISLAMCLFAIKHNSSVYYTQPTYYNPIYSIGTKQSFAYPIIINKINLY